jgi:predicted lipoprotein with Yx(FWY)xxD motif
MYRDLVRHRLLFVALAATTLAAACLAGSAVARAGARVHAVTTARNSHLHKTVLVTPMGQTLYSLSVERHGKFVCVDAACLSFWTPLLVRKGDAPTGIAGLATIARPGAKGRVQVTFHGAPLYTFKLDKKRGDAKGEGIKDVGVWHAASTTKGKTEPASAGGGYGYGR